MPADRVDPGPRARSFGAIAEAYHRHRPGYPDAAVEWALAPLAASASPVLLDLGAGTGKLTAALLRRPAARVTAVEPDAEMRAVLRAALPAVTALAGSAEAVPLPAGAVDAVLVGQAFHWFDPEPATAEIARVLRPGGVVALLWNGEDRAVDWVDAYYDVVRRAERTGLATSERVPRSMLAEGHGLSATSTAEFDNAMPMTIEGMLDNLGTLSWISTLAPAERATTIAQAREYLRGRPETSSGRFVLPLRTTVLRAQRTVR